MIGSAVVGTTLFIASMSATQHHCFDPNDCFDQPGVDKTMSGAGIATLVIGSLIGLGLATHHDSAEVTVVPLRLDAPAVARREGGTRTLDGSGLALRVRF